MRLRMSLQSWSNFTGDESICAHIWTRTDTNGHICRHMNVSTDEFAVMVKFHEVTNIGMHTYEHVWTCMDTHVHIWMSLRIGVQSWSDFTRRWIYMCTRMNTYEHVSTHRYTHEWVYGWVCSHGQIPWGDEHICAHIRTCSNTYGHTYTQMNESTDEFPVTVKFHEEVTNTYMHTYEHVWTHMDT